MHSSLLIVIILIPLLIPSAKGFTVELTQADTPGNEGDNKAITVRLQGFIFGDVTVELKLLTLTQFLSHPEAPNGYSLNEDPAESGEFSYDNDPVHTFHHASSTRQTHDFHIDLVDDAINEEVEQFIVMVNVTNIADSRDEYDKSSSERLNATVTILVDPDNPDITELRVDGAPSTGLLTVSEATTDYSLSLVIDAFPPEQDISISISTSEPSHQSPATIGSDYLMPMESLTLTQSQTVYSLDIGIIDDPIAESTQEIVDVSFSVSSGRPVSFLPRASVTIVIEDNDHIDFGFSSSTLQIREGESATVNILIKSPAMIAVNLTGRVAEAAGVVTTTALATEIPDPFSFTLSQQQKEFPFTISIPSNDDIGPLREREFALRIKDITGASDLYRIDPEIIRVAIKDNDTVLDFGVKDLVTPKLVREGDTFPITIGFVDEDIKLDNDFVLGYSISIMEEGGSPDFAKYFETVLPITGILNAATISEIVSIKTTPNEDVEPDRVFIVLVEHTTVAFNPTVTVAVNQLRVVIEDDDINPPIKPTAKAEVSANNNEMQVTWSVNVTDVNPVDEYYVRVTFPAIKENPEFTVEIPVSSGVSFTTISYTQRGIDYSATNMTIVVCASNPKGEICSDKVYHTRVQQGETNPQSPEGVSPGATAAIVIILLLLLLLLIFLILLAVFYRYFWKNYYPIYREKKNEDDFQTFRKEYDI